MKCIPQLLAGGYMVGIVYAAAFAGAAGFLYLLYRLIKLMRPKKAQLEEKRILFHRFYRVSVRGRVAYLILCLEESLLFYKQDITAWDWILRKMWSFTDHLEDDWVDSWLDSAVELLPSIVLTNKESESVSQEKSNIRILYTQAGTTMIVINAILENTFKMVSEWSTTMTAHEPDVLWRIDEVEETMQAFGVPLPSEKRVQLLLGQINSSLGKPFDGLQLSCLSKAE